MQTILSRAVLLTIMVFMAVPSVAQRVRGRASRQLPPSVQQASDPKLKDLHREFILKAERLVTDYERRKQFGKAQAVYESLLRLVPDHAAAKQALDRVVKAQVTDSKVVTVVADQDWQDSGIVLVGGKPVHMEAKGEWEIVANIGPEGLVIPAAMKLKHQTIQLGTLVGLISSTPNFKNATPFVVGKGTEFKVKQTGRLYFRVYDVDPSDNRGQVFVRVKGLFGK